MSTIPRNLRIIALLLVIASLAILGWWRWSQPAPSDGIPPTATPTSPESGQLPPAAIASQLNFTFTVPVDWGAQLWSRDDFAASSQTVSAQSPRLRESIDRLLDAFRSDSQVYLVRPVTQTAATPALLILSLPSHSLRLEQIAQTFASATTADRLIDTNLRGDGQPILHIRGEQLNGLDSRAARPAEVAILNNFRHGELIVVVQLAASEPDENLTVTAVMEDILRSMVIR